MIRNWFNRIERLAPYAVYPVMRGWYETRDGEDVVAYTIERSDRTVKCSL